MNPVLHIFVVDC